MEENPEILDVPNESNQSFPCSFEGCGQSFPSLAIQCTHEAICPRAGAEMRVTCEICGSRTYAHSLKKHMILHRPAEHQCPLCQKMFHFRYNLTVHLKVHAKKMDPLGEGTQDELKVLLDMLPSKKSVPKKKEPGAFKCPECPAVLTRKILLRYHLNIHRGLTPLACRTEGCSKSFSSPHARFNHERRHHGQSEAKNRANCNVCGMDLHGKSLAKHMWQAHKLKVGQLTKTRKESVVTDRAYQCEICPAVLQRRKTWISHVNQHKGIKPYPCRNEGCREYFSWSCSRRNHEKQCRKSSSDCPICGVHLSNGWVRQDHMVAYHKDESILEHILKSKNPEAPDGDQEGQEDNEEQEEEEDDRKWEPHELVDGRLQCLECGKIFRNRVVFAYHVNMHKGVRPYVCSKCEYAFFSRSALWAHEKKCLAGLKIRKPPTEKVVKPVAKRRVERVPKERKRRPAVPGEVRKQKRKPKPRTGPITCQLCNMVLPSQKMFDRHMAIHAGAGNYWCRQKGCNETFLTLRLRRNHEAEVHGVQIPEELQKPVEQKSFMCDICSSVFKRKRNFLEHMNGHKGIKKLICRNEGCSEAFSSFSARMNHEEPCRGDVIACPVCDKKMKTRNILRIHMRRQHPDQVPPTQAQLRKEEVSQAAAGDGSNEGEGGIKTYSCHLCSRVYCSTKTLADHINIHTGAKPYVCRIEGCKEAFARRINRDYHEMGCKTVSPCPFCDAVLKNPKTLKNHVAAYHDAQKASFDERLYVQIRKDQVVQEQVDHGEDEELVQKYPEGRRKSPAELQIKFEVGDEMQVEWLEDIIEDEAKLLKVKDQEVAEPDDSDEEKINPTKDNAEETSIKLDSSSDFPDTIEIKTENLDPEDQLEAHVEGELLVEPLREFLNPVIGTKPFKCRNGNGCQRTFGNRQSREQHEPRCRGETFRCPRPGCSYGPTSMANVDRHLQWAHADDDEEKVEEQEDNESAKEMTLVDRIKEEPLEVDMEEDREEDREDDALGEDFGSGSEEGPAVRQQSNRGTVAVDKRKYTCEECSKTFTNKAGLNYHMNRHKGLKPYKCSNPDCGLSFPSPWDRSTHTCQGENPPRLSCPCCPETFASMRQRWKHMRQEQHFRSKPPKKEEDEGEGNDRKHVCEVCGASFSHLRTLKFHQFIHDGITPFACRNEGCNKKFRKPDMRNNHEQSCGGKTVECDICKLKLSTRQILAKHKQTKHADVLPTMIEEGPSFMCEICSKIFSRQCHLTLHLKSHKAKESQEPVDKVVSDGGKEMVKCTECLKYLTKGNIRSHMNSHRGIRPFACSNCQQAFFSKQSQYSHEKKCLAGKKMRKSPRVYIKHVDMQPKEPTIHQCPICLQEFPTRYALYHHKQKHEDVYPLRCTEGCSNTFTRIDLLRKHLREVHEIGIKTELKMEKTLKCDHCPMMFGFKAALVRHMKLHNDPSRSTCTNAGCNQTFANEKMLNKHLASCFNNLSLFGEQ